MTTCTMATQVKPTSPYHYTISIFLQLYKIYYYTDMSCLTHMAAVIQYLIVTEGHINETLVEEEETQIFLFFLSYHIELEVEGLKTGF